MGTPKSCIGVTGQLRERRLDGEARVKDVLATYGDNNHAASEANAMENGTGTGAKEGEEADEEEAEPIDMSFPKDQGWKKILVYLVSLPIMGPLFLTLPDTKNEKSKSVLTLK